MASAAKVAGITVLALLVVGLVVGSLTWAILASQGPTAPDPPELLELEWWQDVVLYQIYPRSFKDSDGDGIGDLKGITSQLEHFVDCGVGAIWLSPIFKSPMVDFGYDVSDFYAIQDEYGTMADFEEMVQKAHSLGIKVLLDYVPNHSSDKAEYFMKSVRRQDGYDNWYVWADPIPDPNDPTKTTVPSNWISQFGGSVWRWNNIRQQYYLHQFAAEQPDFNFREPAVRQEMRNIMAFWFEKGVDGFRMDAVPHMFETAPDENGRYPDEPLTHNPFLRPDQPGYTTQIHVRDLPELYDVIYEWRDFTTEWQRKHGGEPKILLAEAYANVPKTMLYYGDEKGRLGANFPFNFDFITELSGHSNARDFAYIIQRWMTYMPRGMTANWVFGNHDQPRMPSRFSDIMVDGLNSLNILLPGVSITYQGEEIGMRDGFVSWEDTKDVNAINQGNEDNYLEFSRDPCRTPYHWDSTTSAGFSTNPKTWLPVAQDYTEINLKKQKDDARSHFKVYQALTKLKKEPSLTHGDYRVYPLTANTLVFVRSLVTYDTYALVFNVGTESDTVDLSTVPHLAEPMEVYISSTHSTRVAGDEIGFGNITLRPGEALVLKAPPT